MTVPDIVPFKFDSAESVTITGLFRLISKAPRNHSTRMNHDFHPVHMHGVKSVKEEDGWCLVFQVDDMRARLDRSYGEVWSSSTHPHCSGQTSIVVPYLRFGASARMSRSTAEGGLRIAIQGCPARNICQRSRSQEIRRMGDALQQRPRARSKSSSGVRRRRTTHLHAALNADSRE